MTSLSSKIIDFDRRELMTPEIKLDLITSARDLEDSMRNHAAMYHNGLVVRLYNEEGGIAVYVNGKLRLTLI